MKEQVLFDYFLEKTSAEILAEDLKDAVKHKSLQSSSVYIESLETDDEFEVTREHLLKLSNDALDNKLSLIDINTIAFVIISSDFFTYNTDDERLNRVLFDWDNPEIGFPLTKENMYRWKQILLTGIDDFDFKELNKKKGR